MLSGCVRVEPGEPVRAGEGQPAAGKEKTGTNRTQNMRGKRKNGASGAWMAGRESGSSGEKPSPAGRSAQLEGSTAGETARRVEGGIRLFAEGMSSRKRREERKRNRDEEEKDDGFCPFGKDRSLPYGFHRNLPAPKGEAPLAQIPAAGAGISLSERGTRSSSAGSEGAEKPVREESGKACFPQSKRTRENPGEQRNDMTAHPPIRPGGFPLLQRGRPAPL